MTTGSATPSAMCVVAFGLVLTLACAPSAEGTGDAVLVSAAASLAPAFTEVAEAYEQRHPERTVLVNTASSGILARQIEHGATVDLFLSASPQEIFRLDQKGLLQPGTTRPIASGELVVVVPAGATPPPSVGELADTGYGRIAIGNPETVPQGRYARQALEGAGIWDQIVDRVVIAENARQVLDYVVRGEVDAALVYRTDARLLPDAVAVGSDAATNPRILYVGSVPADAPRPDLGRDLLAFVVSADGQSILARFGFAPAER